MCTLRMLDVVKERPQSGNGHVNGLSPGKKNRLYITKDARSHSGHVDGTV